MHCHRIVRLFQRGQPWSHVAPWRYSLPCRFLLAPDCLFWLPRGQPWSHVAPWTCCHHFVVFFSRLFFGHRVVVVLVNGNGRLYLLVVLLGSVPFPRSCFFLWHTFDIAILYLHICMKTGRHKLLTNNIIANGIHHQTK